MRFLTISVFLLCSFWAASVAHADDPFDLHQNSAQNHWLETPPQKRLAIVNEWQALPATTRQPFPIFRDRVLEDLFANAPPDKEAAQK